MTPLPLYLCAYCLGACMKNLNVTVGDSRDSEGKKRFFPFHPQNHLIPSSGKKDWAYFVYTQYAEVCKGHISTISLSQVFSQMELLVVATQLSPFTTSALPPCTCWTTSSTTSGTSWLCFLQLYIFPRSVSGGKAEDKELGNYTVAG